MIVQPQNPLAPPPPIGVQAPPGPQLGPPSPAFPNGTPIPSNTPAPPPEPIVPQFTGAGSDIQNQATMAVQRRHETEDIDRNSANATFDADLRRRADETFAEFERSLNPQWEARARQFEQSLVGRGIDPNSEAGRNARGEFDRGRTDAFSQARRAANQDGVALQNQRWQQQFARDQQRAGELFATSAMTGQQMNLDHDREWRQRAFDEDRRRYDEGFGEDSYRWDQGFDQQSGNMDFQQMMQMMGFDQGVTGQNNMTQQMDFGRLMQMMGFMPQGGPAGVDVMGPHGLNMQAQAANAQNAQQRSNGFWGGLGQLGGGLLGAAGNAGGFGALFSDARVKDEIRQVGTLHNGLPVYAYRYKWGGPTQLGVMAQDVEVVNPDAVIEIEGIKMVNYDMAVQ